MPARALAAALLLALAAPAQKTCYSANVNAKPRLQGTIVNAWFAFPIQVTTATVVTGADFYMSTNTRLKTDGKVQVGFFNSSGSLPNQVVGRVNDTISSGVYGWYGGRFAKPFVVTPGRWFVAFRNTGGALPSVSSGGTPTPYYWGPPVFPTWRGPINGLRFSYRVYCGAHGGTWLAYGSGKAGSGGFVPRIRGLGQPNTTNTVHIQTSRGLGGAPSLLLLGTRVAIQAPFGTLYTLPVTSLAVTLANGGSGLGHFTLPLALPNDGKLKGLPIAFQHWVLDPGATAALAHTPGLLMTIGH